MGGAWNALWLTIAFVSECAALIALAMAGWSIDAGVALRLAAAIGLPLVAAVLWGVFAAPRAPVRHRGLSAGVKAAVLGSGVLALHVTGHPGAAVTLAVGAVLGVVLPARSAGQVSARPR